MLFSGEVGPACASLWVWCTNFEIDARNAYALANGGGRARQNIENVLMSRRTADSGWSPPSARTTTRRKTTTC